MMMYQNKNLYKWVFELFNYVYNKDRLQVHDNEFVRDGGYCDFNILMDNINLLTYFVICKNGTNKFKNVACCGMVFGLQIIATYTSVLINSNLPHSNKPTKYPRLMTSIIKALTQ